MSENKGKKEKQETKEVKEEVREMLEDSFYAYVGALASVVEHVNERREEFVEKGKEATKKGKDLNKELKHKVADYLDDDEKDIVDLVKEMSAENKAKLKEALLNDKSDKA